MSESRFSPTRLAGWKRAALPCVMATLLGTPMLWALGVFDTTADPLRHAAVFGLSGMLLSASLPWCIGWALQGFLQRLKSESDSHAEPHHQTPPHRPGGPSHAGRHS